MPSDDDLTTRLEQLLAKQAIAEVLYTYCRALDRADRALASMVWHPQGTADYGEELFVGSGEGFLDWVFEAHSKMASHSHMLGNILVEIRGNRAVSETYATSALCDYPAASYITHIISRGRYLDRWSRQDGIWAIDHRHYMNDLTVVHRVPEAAIGEGMRITGRRDLTDPSYELLRPMGA